MDGGIDFYATQTTLAPDGRRIMTAWLQTWSDTEDKPKGCKWFGQTICPRELHIKDGRIVQTPVRDVYKRQGGSVFHVLCIADVLAQPDADSAIAVQVFAILRKSGFDGVGGILRQSTFAHIGDLIVRQGLAPVQGVGQPADAHPEHHGCDDEIDPVVMPVSYTHLDVYKRQLWGWGICKRGIRCR